MRTYEDAIKLWQSWRVRSEADIDLRLDNFRILFAYNSGKIENGAITYSDTREIFENGRILNYTGTPRTLFELSNQKLCYEFLKPKIEAGKPITIALIKDIHCVLTSGTYDERRYVEQGERPGEFKRHDYVIGITEAGSTPEDVENDLTELLDEITGYSGPEIIKAASYLHARFEHIHPFADGNGRVGRALLNYYLILNDHPPLIIHDDDKVEYYNALATYDATEDIEPMIAFLKRQTVRTWEKSLEREQRRSD